MDFLGVFYLGILLSFLGVFLAVRFFPRLGLLDFPERYRLKRARLPYPGGLVFLFLSLGLLCFDERFSILIAAACGLGILSFLDDQRPISAYFRIILHFCIAAFVFWGGVKISFVGNPFAGTNFELVSYPWISFVLTVLWIVAIQNAMNWFDGIRGLAVGVSGIGFLTLGALGLVRPELFFDPAHASLTVANFFLGGLCVGGFWWFWKGKIILGDTGSQVLGFLLATMSIFAGAKIATTLLVLGLPILDAVFVVFRRVFLEKRSPFHGDLSHLHHHLAEFLGEGEAALLLVFLSGVLGAIALSFSGIEKALAVTVVSVGIWGFCWWLWGRVNGKE